MLAVPKNFVKGPPEKGVSGGVFDPCLKAAFIVIAAMAAFNIGVAYRDALDHRTRAAALERQLETARARNERLDVRIRGLARNPALLERWLRERELTLPGEEVLPRNK